MLRTAAGQFKAAMPSGRRNPMKNPVLARSASRSRAVRRRWSGGMRRLRIGRRAEVRGGRRPSAAGMARHGAPCAGQGAPDGDGARRESAQLRLQAAARNAAARAGFDLAESYADTAARRGGVGRVLDRPVRRNAPGRPIAGSTPGRWPAPARGPERPVRRHTRRPSRRPRPRTGRPRPASGSRVRGCRCARRSPG